MRYFTDNSAVWRTDVDGNNVQIRVFDEPESWAASSFMNADDLMHYGEAEIEFGMSPIIEISEEEL